MITPKTGDHMSFVEFSNTKSKEYKKHFGPATVYVIHSWRTSFADTVDMLKRHENEEPGTMYWIDMFSLSLQDMKNVDQFRKTFQEKILPYCNVLMLMSIIHTDACPDPDGMSDLYSLPSSTWCLWEVFITLKDQKKCVMYLPTSQLEIMFHHITDIPAALERIFRDMRIENSFAHNPEVKPFLLETLKREPLLNFEGAANATTHFNNFVTRCLGNMFLVALQTRAQVGLPGTVSVPLLENIATFGLAINQFDFSLACFDLALDLCGKTFGLGSLEVACSEARAGAANLQRGLPNDIYTGLTYSRQAVGPLSRAYGEDHPLVLLALRTIVACSSINEPISDLTLYALQRLVHSVCLARGESDAETAALHEQLGSVQLRRGAYGLAVGHLAQALQVRLAIHGPNTLAVLDSYCMLADAHVCAGSLSVAVTFYGFALSTCESLMSRDTTAYRLVQERRARVHRATLDAGLAPAVIAEARQKETALDGVARQVKTAIQKAATTAQPPPPRRAVPTIQLLTGSRA